MLRMLKCLCILLFALVAAAAAAQEAEDQQTGTRQTGAPQTGAQQTEAETEAYSAARAAMVEAVQLQARMAARETGIAEVESAVLDAMRQVPRHRFLPPQLQPAGYLDLPLPAMSGATVSQPLIVALMLHAASVQADAEALVVGVGAGYLTTLLVEMGVSVRAVEYDQEVASYAAGRFDELGYSDINLRIGDGYYGWPDADRQFDAIIVRLALPEIPPTLTAQLAPGGRLVAPVGQPEGRQWLTVVERGEDGELQERRLLEVRFTPLPGGIRL